MFWGCFLYNKKGPYYIWKDKTDKEKYKAKEWIKKKNRELEPIYRLEWELLTKMQRVRITRNISSRKLKWRWCNRIGKLK
jgi:hypothetical protein